LFTIPKNFSGKMMFFPFCFGNKPLLLGKLMVLLKGWREAGNQLSRCSVVRFFHRRLLGCWELFMKGGNIP